MAKRYLLYARVSPKGSTWAAEETSIRVQFADMRRHILQTDPAAEFIEIEDEFKSGKNLNRPGVQRIMADLCSQPVPWECLVVWNLDRLSRSLTDALPIFQKLRDAGCEFVSVNQAYLSYTGAMARYMLHQTIAIAELERGMTSERVSAKMRYIAESGKVPWGKLPLGYKRDPERKNTVIVDPEKAEIVRTVFDWYVSGRLSFAAIDQRWPGVIKDRPFLYRMLRQRLYIGELSYNGKVYSAEHPAIIDRGQFERAQQMLLEKKRQSYIREGAAGHEYLLSGMVRCQCGRMMTGYSVHGRKDGQRFYYYKCTSPKCKKAVNADALDAKVLELVTEVYQDPDEIRKSLSEYLQSEREKSLVASGKKGELDKQLQKARAGEEDIKRMFLTGVVTPENAEYWNGELLAVRTEREHLERELSSLLTSDVPDFEEIFPELQAAAGEWAKKIVSEKADYATKRNLIMSAVKEIACIDRDRDRIKFRLTLIMTSSKEWWA